MRRPLIKAEASLARFLASLCRVPIVVCASLSVRFLAPCVDGTCHHRCAPKRPSTYEAFRLAAQYFFILTLTALRWEADQDVWRRARGSDVAPVRLEPVRPPKSV